MKERFGAQEGDSEFLAAAGGAVARRAVIRHDPYALDRRFGRLGPVGTVYDQLDPRIRDYVDSLIAHARSALWPERRAALASFRRGIARSAPDDLAALLSVLAVEPASGEDAADLAFRAVVTAYIERLAEVDVTNPDQALVYGQSLDAAHVALAGRWLDSHPEHAPGAPGGPGASPG